MRNLDQIRAANALAAKNSIKGGVNDGEVVKKVPSMIMNNGLLAAAAFAVETRKGYEDVFKAIIDHLKYLKRLPGTHTDLEEFISDLSVSDSVILRDITAEAMAYLNYLRSFARKGD